MKLYFKCKKNHHNNYIDYAVFTKDGKEYEVDFWESATCCYDPETGECELYWEEVYAWDGEHEIPLHKDFFRGAKFEGFVIYDDAPDDFEITVEEWDYTETDWD